MTDNPWHEWTLWWPRRGIDGKWLFDRVWRRKTDAGWEYKERERTDEEYASEQW